MRAPSGTAGEEVAGNRNGEGIRLHRMIPGSRLLLSGGAAYDTSTDAAAMSLAAAALGVGPAEMTTESESQDTVDQARLLAPLLRGEKFILVTSASHMPRAMSLFTKMGMRPIPAPTDYLVTPEAPLRPSRIFPSIEALRQSDNAVHEELDEARLVADLSVSLFPPDLSPCCPYPASFSRFSPEPHNSPPATLPGWRTPHCPT